ncbi:hypothetical protein [Dethiosulfatarculus sandiegensis]|uniref:Methyltransferase type 11 domain-containing protein n=1 Tax=Dethiosulfatarculus sandiegensis TaxID=1429043 RepID=A0A0D2HU53_9BACT|nr:hypothetical protein [Dethiosulfatarculus sandiegensis]KIX13983.1 hypothetical protein X474_12860 [Dethiosulfatarculus sandiegensis]
MPEMSEIKRNFPEASDEMGQDQVCALDMGAGNGMADEQLRFRLDCESLVGVDIFPEAKQVVFRDRPGVYDEYLRNGPDHPEGSGREKKPGAKF